MWIRAALACFALVFAAGFAFGTIRMLWLVPALGSETAAVLAELPFMIAISWLAARFTVRRFAVPRGARAAAMGALAFALLMGAEAALGILAFGQSAGEWARALFALPGILGLSGQIAFAFFPLIAARR
jgi:hypothetical protein